MSSALSTQAQHKRRHELPKIENGRYAYTFGNGTDWEINFFLSTDSIKWKQFTIEPSHQEKMYYDNEKLYFKIYTSKGRRVEYKIPGNVVYKIYFNPATNNFDLLKFSSSSYMDQ